MLEVNDLSENENMYVRRLQCRRKIMPQIEMLSGNEKLYVPVTVQQILADIEQSEKEISEGKCRPMDEALSDMGKRYGFL